MLHIIYIALFVFSDRLTKYLAVKYLMPIGSAKVLDGIFSLTYVENKGIAFGLLKGMNWFVVPLNICIVLVCGYFLIKAIEKKKRLVALSLNLVISGALGNVIDKIFYGYVIDFMEFSFVDFPVFNLADVFICVGAFLAATIILFSKDGDLFDFKK